MRRDRYVRPRAKVFTGHSFEPVMWPIGILLSGAITALLRLHLKNVFMALPMATPPALASRAVCRSRDWRTVVVCQR